MARRVWVILSLLVLTIAPACGVDGGSTESPPALEWTPVDLPDSMNPRSLALSGPDLLVGGRSSVGGDHPVLAAIGGDRTTRAVPLTPNSPYAKVADLVSVAADGTEIVALGAAHGGAHSNVRWTVWRGTAERLVDYPQTFETFGGTSAGGLSSMVMTDDGPVITGTWSAASGRGLDAAVWLPDGETWKRQTSEGTALANTDLVQVAPRAATGNGQAVIIAGSLITFEPALRQTAAVWTWPRRDADWALARLPDAGEHSEAVSGRCAEACWVSGHVDGQVALWRVGPGEVVREALPGGLAIDGPAQTILAGDRPGVLFSHAGRSTLVVKNETGWPTFAAPDGTVVDAIVAGDRLYAILSADRLTTRLWTARLD